MHSMALSHVHINQPDQSLQNAIIRFQSVLTEDQRKEFDKIKSVPNVDTVITFTADLDIANPERKGKSIGKSIIFFPPVRL
jgi:hypothetical protein